MPSVPSPGELWAFAKSLWNHWTTVVVGPFASVLLLVVDKLVTRWTVPRWVYAVVFFGMIPIAAFQVWLDEHRGRLVAEQAKVTLEREHAASIGRKSDEARINAETERERLQNEIGRLRRELGQSQSRERELAEKKFGRAAVGVFLAEGQRLLQRCEIEPDLPENEGLNWDRRVATWLRESLGDSYVVRFRNRAGLLPMGPLGSRRPCAYWQWLDHRLQRLNEIARLFD